MGKGIEIARLGCCRTGRRTIRQPILDPAQSVSEPQTAVIQTTIIRAIKLRMLVKFPLIVVRPLTGWVVSNLFSTYCEDNGLHCRSNRAHFTKSNLITLGNLVAKIAPNHLVDPDVEKSSSACHFGRLDEP